MRKEGPLKDTADGIPSMNLGNYNKKTKERGTALRAGLVGEFTRRNEIHGGMQSIGGSLEGGRCGGKSRREEKEGKSIDVHLPLRFCRRGVNKGADHIQKKGDE